VHEEAADAGGDAAALQASDAIDSAGNHVPVPRFTGTIGLDSSEGGLVPVAFTAVTVKV